MHRNGYLWTSSVNLDTAIWFADPDLLSECKKFQRFGDVSRWFLILYAECPPYFYFRFVWTTDPESTPHASTPTSIIPTKFEVATATHCRVIGFLSANTSRDLVTLTFDFEQLTCMAGHVTNPATKFEDNTTFLSWVTSYNVSIGYHWKCSCGHCACAESRDPWIGGQKQLHFWNLRPDLPIHYTTSIGLRRRLRVVYSRAVQC